MRSVRFIFEKIFSFKLIARSVFPFAIVIVH